MYVTRTILEPTFQDFDYRLDNYPERRSAESSNLRYNQFPVGCEEFSWSSIADNTKRPFIKTGISHFYGKLISVGLLVTWHISVPMAHVRKDNGWSKLGLGQSEKGMERALLRRLQVRPRRFLLRPIPVLCEGWLTQ